MSSRRDGLCLQSDLVAACSCRAWEQGDQSPNSNVSLVPRTLTPPEISLCDVAGQVPAPSSPAFKYIEAHGGGEWGVGVAGAQVPLVDHHPPLALPPAGAPWMAGPLPSA